MPPVRSPGDGLAADSLHKQPKRKTSDIGERLLLGPADSLQKQVEQVSLSPI